MVFNKGVIVSVNRCDGQLYKGYAPTQSEADIATGAKLVYLEAVRSETFYVTVELQRYFDFKSSPVVEIACSIGERQAFGYVQAEDVKRAETAPGQAKPKYCQARTRRFMNGMWMERGEDVATILLGKHRRATRMITRLTRRSCRRQALKWYPWNRHPRMSLCSSYARIH